MFGLLLSVVLTLKQSSSSFLITEMKDTRHGVVRCFIWLKESVLVSITVLFNLCCDTFIKVIAMIT
jgi:hypothetical protein